ncbi:MAG: autotransporter outer membrane beta-barrel domain-containing protein [Reyranella sp.]|nr:autotransporter outer membrane beta-barrel domain-containing protein [Reyranella sp.]
MAQPDLGNFLRANIQSIQTQLRVQSSLLQTQEQSLQNAELAVKQAFQNSMQQTIQLANSLRASTSSIAADMSQMVSAVHANSCPVFAGQSTLLTEDSCVWAKLTGRKVNQFAADSHTDSATFRVGGQKEIAADWFLGGLAGFGSSWSQAGNGASANGQTAEGAVALKRVVGPWFLSGVLGFATTSLHIDRPDGVPGSNTRLQSDSSSFQGTGRARAAYEFAFAEWYVRPRFDFDLTYTSLPGYQETGVSPLALSVSGSDKLSVALTPTVEVGGCTNLSDTLILRPYLALGASYMPDNSSTMVASFQGPLASLGSFQTTFNGPSVLANVEIGVQLYEVRGFEAKLDYTLSAGDSFLSQGLSLRGAWHF